MLISRLQTLNIEWRAATVQPGTLLWAQAPGHHSRKCACHHILLPRFRTTSLSRSPRLIHHAIRAGTVVHRSDEEAASRNGTPDSGAANGAMPSLRGAATSVSQSRLAACPFQYVDLLRACPHHCCGLHSSTTGCHFSRQRSVPLTALCRKPYDLVWPGGGLGVGHAQRRQRHTAAA